MFKKKNKKRKGNKFVRNFNQDNNRSTEKKQTFKSKKNRSTTTKKKKIFLIVAIIVLLVLFWLFFVSNIFTIKKISISETSNTPQTTIEKIIWEQTQTKKFFVAPQSNLLLLNKQDLSDKLYNEFQLKELNISKRLPNTLNIDIIEKEYTVVWNESNKFYHINRRGDIIITEDSPREGYIAIYNNGDSKKLERKIDVAPSIIDFITDFTETAKIKNTIKIKEFIIDDTIRTIRFKEERGPIVILSTEEDIKKQVTKLEALIEKELTGNFDRQNYIDLRYGDRIFYQ